MRKIFPEYKINAIRELIVPELRRQVPNEELTAALSVLIKDGAKPLRQLADLFGVNAVVLRRKLKAAGIKPVALGGPSGREGMYMLSDVQLLLERERR